MAYVRLSSANMGDVTEADFDMWAEYVNERIDEACGFLVEVTQARFGEPGDDFIADGVGDQNDTVREAIATLWESWCATGWNEAVAARAQRVSP